MMIETNSKQLEFEDDEVNFVLSKGNQDRNVKDRLADALTIMPWITQGFAGTIPQDYTEDNTILYDHGERMLSSRCYGCSEYGS